MYCKWEWIYKVIIRKNSASQWHYACCVKAIVLNKDKTKLTCVCIFNPNTDFLYHIPCFN